MNIKHIIVAGPESSGKTTLSGELAKGGHSVLIPEYARGYLIAAQRKAVAADFNHFVQVNAQLLLAAQQKLRTQLNNQGCIIQDTGIETLKLWMQDKFDHVAPVVEKAFAIQKPDLYLLCYPDIAWQRDSLREDEHRRDYLFHTMAEMLSKEQARVVKISGDQTARYQLAREAIKALT